MNQRAPGGESASRRKRLRLRTGPTSWAMASLLLFLVLAPYGANQLWSGFLLAIPFLIATTGFGWRAAAVLTPMGLFMLWVRNQLSGSPAAWSDYLGLALVMAIAALAGNQLYALWRTSERRARHSERRARLLQNAAMELNQAKTEQSLFRRAPRLLSAILPFTHGEVFLPLGEALKVHTSWRWDVSPDFTIPLTTVTGRAFTTGEAQYVSNTALDPDFMAAPGAEPTRSELALPIVVADKVRAVLNLEDVRLNAFGAHDRAVLGAFARMIEEVLERLDASAALNRQKVEQKLLAQLGQRLLLADTVAAAADAALEELMAALDVDTGVVLDLSHGKLRSIAARGEFPPVLQARLSGGFPFLGLLREAWEGRETLFVDDCATDPIWTTSTEARSVAAIPILDTTGQVQALLGLTRLTSAKPWRSDDERLLRSAASSLAAALDRATLNRQLLAMLDVVRRLSSTDAPATLYHRAAQAALELVPGAEAATIQVRHGELFQYEAAVGYELDELQVEVGPFTYQEQLKWYGAGAESFEAGEARVLRGPEILRRSVASQRSTAQKARGRVTSMRCHVLVPILDVDGVVAVLNIDNFSTEDAFGRSAVRLAEAFAQHIAVVVRQAEQMVALERSAITDSLTGLSNREGFGRILNQEIARARRYGHHLNMVMIDLDNFKQVNDRFGHPVGDSALVAVANALDAAKRSTDAIFRWGGDEFVILLPEVAPESASCAMERFVSVIDKVQVQGMRLSASAGLASYPDDGADATSLLACADQRMYHYKQSQQVLQAARSASPSC